DARAIRAAGPAIATVMVESTASTAVAYRGQSLSNVQIRGVTREYNDIPSTRIESGRSIAPGEFDSGRAVAVIGWDVADQLFGELEPLEKTILIDGVQFRVVGVAPKLGSIFGQSQDQFAVVPLPALQRLFGSRMSLRFTVRPPNPDLVQTAMDETR